MTFGPIRVRMSARDAAESHRASTPLELLFDLVFVVAIAQLVSELAHAIIEGHLGEQILPFAMVFFAIWWAWMNFTWFASAFDVDDVPYRLMTLVQMGGVLVLAAGVPGAFGEQNFTAVTIGYFIMRIGLVAQWVRAAVEHPQSRPTAIRYAVGLSVLQVGWLLRLALPPETGVASFAVLAALDLAVPLWAERSGTTAWHPHHIAERYGLFTIILLGESVLAATTGVQASIAAGGVSAELVALAVCALVLLFSLWWLYFLEPAGDGLARNRGRSFLWGYGHYGVFAALAALGAALEVSVESAGHPDSVDGTVVSWAIAIPVTLYLVLLWALHAPIVDRVVIRPAGILTTAVVVLAIPPSAASMGVVGVVVATTAVVAALVAVTVATTRRR